MTKRATIWAMAAVLAVLIAAMAWLYIVPPSTNGTAKSSASLDRPLRIGIVSWPGYAGGIVANGGFRPNKTSLYFTKYNQQVEFIILEDVDARAKAFARGDVDIVWTTVDFWANELPGFISNDVPAKVVMQVDWSRGGDAIVADKSISSPKDLVGKKVALALLTPSQWLLENALSRSGLPESQVTSIITSAIAKNASPDARTDFIARRADAAVVWEPDVSEALRQRPGSHVLISSATPGYDQLLADCMVVRKAFIDQHPEAVRAFVQGWLEGTELAKANHELVVRLLMENEPLYASLGAEQTRADLAKVKWADLSDNKEMFGLDGRPALFDKLFSDASKLWIRRKVIKEAVSPKDAVDTQFLKTVL